MSLSSFRCALATVSLLATGSAHAISVYNTPVPIADWTGPTATRSTSDLSPGGLTGNAQWSTDFRISWAITDNGNGTLTYIYTFSGFGSPDRDISNFVLDISDDCPTDSFCVYNAKFNGSPIGSGDIEFGDINGITGAVKFDVGSGAPAVYEFTSNRLPVWGHLAMKDGGGSATCASGSFGGTALACSNQLLGIGLDSDPLNYVARPNGLASVVPLPAAVWLFGSALAGLAVVRRRRD
jgi:hypothetical protein